MKAIFKIEAINGTRAKGQVYSGEVEMTGEGEDPTLPQVVNSLMHQVTDERPQLHLATEMEIRVELV